MIVVFKDWIDWEELDNWNTRPADFVPIIGDEVMLRIKGVEHKYLVVRRLATSPGSVTVFVREVGY